MKKYFIILIDEYGDKIENIEINNNFSEVLKIAEDYYLKNQMAILCVVKDENKNILKVYKYKNNIDDDY